MPAAKLTKAWPPHAAGVLIATDSASALAADGRGADAPPGWSLKTAAFVEVGASRFDWLDRHGYFGAGKSEPAPPGHLTTFGGEAPEQAAFANAETGAPITFDEALRDVDPELEEAQAQIEAGVVKFGGKP